MNEPTMLEEQYFVAPQIYAEDLPRLKELGFERIINNRPDGEVEDQPTAAVLREQAEALDLEYVENAIDLKALSQDHVVRQSIAIDQDKKTLAFCRTGTRSSVVWVLLKNAAGEDYSSLCASVQAKGFDLSRCEAAMSPLAK
ncbi:protein tyrosine phosphatase family protein [Marinomonas epiphytica]